MGYKNLLLLILAFAVVYVQAAPEQSINIGGGLPSMTDLQNQINSIFSTLANGTISATTNMKEILLQQLTLLGGDSSLIEKVKQNFKYIEEILLQLFRYYAIIATDVIFILILKIPTLIRSLGNAIPGGSAILNATNLPHIVANELIPLIRGYTG